MMDRLRVIRVVDWDLTCMLLVAHLDGTWPGGHKRGDPALSTGRSGQACRGADRDVHS